MEGLRREITILEGEEKEPIDKAVEECHGILKEFEPGKVIMILSILIESFEDCTGADFVKSYVLTKRANKKLRGE